MGLGEGIAWSIITTQNLGIVLWNNWLPESFAQFISFIGAIIVAIIISVAMSNSGYNTGGLLLGGLIGAVIAGGILHTLYITRVHNK